MEIESGSEEEIRATFDASDVFPTYRTSGAGMERNQLIGWEVPPVPVSLFISFLLISEVDFIMSGRIHLIRSSLSW